MAAEEVGVELSPIKGPAGEVCSSCASSELNSKSLPCQSAVSLSLSDCLEREGTFHMSAPRAVLLFVLFTLPIALLRPLMRVFAALPCAEAIG